MSAFVTTLGMFNLLIVFLWCLFTLLTVLPPGQGSQLSYPGPGCFSDLPAQLPPLRLAGPGGWGLTLCLQTPGGPSPRFPSCQVEHI